MFWMTRTQSWTKQSEEVVVPINSPRYRWRELNGKQRAELDVQIVELADAFLDDIGDLDRGQAFDETRLAEHLPRQFLVHYNTAFAKRFLVAFLTVTWKLKDPTGVHVCANQAEELALYALIQATEGALPLEMGDLSTFQEAVFEDSDFLFLFDPAMDGIAEAMAAVDPTITAYDVKDWFEPFNDRDRPVHPYQLLAPRPVAGRSDTAPDA